MRKDIQKLTKQEQDDFYHEIIKVGITRSDEYVEVFELSNDSTEKDVFYSVVTDYEFDGEDFKVIKNSSSGLLELFVNGTLKFKEGDREHPELPGHYDYLNLFELYTDKDFDEELYNDFIECVEVDLEDYFSEKIIDFINDYQNLEEFLVTINRGRQPLTLRNRSNRIKFLI